MEREAICIVGLDEPEYAAISEKLSQPVIAHPILPRIVVKDGVLSVEAMHGRGFVPVSKVIYHSIFDNDFDFITGLALWGGPCLPNARAMMDARMKYACLVRALDVTCFGGQRGYASPGTRYYTETERVAKWGNWHCGENKERFSDVFAPDEPAIIEDFFPGDAVRLAIIGDRYWQIKLEGEGWLKSIHPDSAAFMEVDPDLLDDTRTIQRAFGLEVIANDYIVSPDGSKHLLEVNHIPNVTRFPDMWEAYRDLAVDWVNGDWSFENNVTLETQKS